MVKLCNHALTPPLTSHNELAKERNRAAAERTLMAWIRTSLSLISFGIGIDQIVEALHAALTKVESLHLSRTISLSFISIGTSALLSAAFSHHRNLQQIDLSLMPRTYRSVSW